MPGAAAPTTVAAVSFLLYRENQPSNAAARRRKRDSKALATECVRIGLLSGPALMQRAVMVMIMAPES